MKNDIYSILYIIYATNVTSKLQIKNKNKKIREKLNAATTYIGKIKYVYIIYQVKIKLHVRTVKKETSISAILKTFPPFL